jgi:heme exporter protein A
VKRGGVAAIQLEAKAVEHRFAPGRGLQAATFAHTGAGCLAILGTNGAGKSTLLRIVAGLLRPTSGSLELSIDGKAVPPAGRRHVVGFASPELSFYDEFTVGENLMFVAEARGMSERPERVRVALQRVGLLERIEDRVAALSSGMKQRLRLAFALLHEPPVLLLDEPGSHLDDVGRAVTEAIVAAHRETGLVMLATNDERERQLADSRVELRGGLGRPA